MARIQFDMTPSKLSEFELLMDHCGFKTKKDLLENAVCLLKKAVHEVRSGRSVAFIDKSDGTYSELVTPYLEHVLDSSPAIVTQTEAEEAARVAEEAAAKEEERLKQAKVNGAAGATKGKLMVN